MRYACELGTTFGEILFVLGSHCDQIRLECGLMPGLHAFKVILLLENNVVSAVDDVLCVY